MTIASFVLVTVIVVSLIILGTAVLMVFRDARESRNRTGELLQQLAHAAWISNTTLAYSTVAFSTLHGTSLGSIQEASDALRDADTLAESLVSSRSAKEADWEALRGFMQAFILACREGYRQEYLDDVTAVLVQDADSVGVLTQYLGATTNPSLAVAAFRSGIPPEYAGEL